MKRLFAMCLAASALASAGETEVDAVVRFANEDRIEGTIESLTKDQLTLSSPILEKPAPFHLDKVLEVGLDAVYHDVDANHEAVVTLNLGDVIRGQLAEVTDEFVSLDTWYAGRLDIRRGMVASLEIEPKRDDLYHGPESMDDWVLSGDENAWSYRRLALVARGKGGIALPDVLPDQCSVTFDAAWKADALSLKIYLLSEEPDSESPESGYEVSIQRQSVYLRNCSKQRYLGSASNSGDLRENTRARIELRASSKNGRVVMLVNGQVIETWTDPDVADGRFGGALHFVSPNPGAIRISNIRVSRWNGVVDETVPPRVPGRRFRIGGLPDDFPETEDKPEDDKRMKLANSDSIDGEVKSISGGVITIETKLGEIKVPVSRFRTLALKPVEYDEAILRNGDVRAWFPDRTSMVFRLDSVDGGKITGSSQNFGTAEFDIRAFSRIEFEIHNDEYDSLRGEEDW